VSVADESGLPLSGIDVQIEALIGSGQNVLVNGAIGNPGTDLITTLTMGNGGFKEFVLSAPNQINVPITSPDPVSASPSFSGAGSLADGSYAYVVTAVDAVGGEAASFETASITITNATVSADQATITWTPVVGAAGYRVYGRTSGAEGFLASVATSTTLWVDNGTVAPGAAVPGTNPFNSTGVAANTVRVSIGASSGASQDVVNASIY
jgi:hypothetical protein